MVHYMPEHPAPTPRKVFTYSLHRTARPLPGWICQRVIEHDAEPRLVRPIDIRAPLVDEDEKILEFGGNFCAKAESQV